MPELESGRGGQGHGTLERAKREFGEHIKQLRESAGLTQHQIVALSGRNSAAVALYEHGEHLPAKAYVDTLLAEVDKRAPAPLTEDVRRLTFDLLVRALDGPQDTQRRALLTAQLQQEVHERQGEQLRAGVAELAVRIGEITDEQADAGSPGAAVALAEPSRKYDALLKEQAAWTQRRGRLQAEIDSYLAELPAEGDTGLVPYPVPLPVQPPPMPPMPPTPPQKPTRMRKVPWVLAAVLALGLIVAVLLWPSTKTAPAPVAATPTPSALATSAAPASAVTPTLSDTPTPSDTPTATATSTATSTDGTQTDGPSGDPTDVFTGVNGVDLSDQNDWVGNDYVEPAQGGSVNGHTYTNALTSHCFSPPCGAAKPTIQFRLDRQYSGFEALLGLDDEQDIDAGSAKFTVTIIANYGGNQDKNLYTHTFLAGQSVDLKLATTNVYSLQVTFSGPIDEAVMDLGDPLGFP